MPLSRSSWLDQAVVRRNRHVHLKIWTKGGLQKSALRFFVQQQGRCCNMEGKSYVWYATLAVLAVGCGAFFYFKRLPQPALETPLVHKINGQRTALSEKTLVHLYFADKSNHYLTSENRVLTYNADPAQFSRIIMAALIDGSRADLMRTIPAGTGINACFVTQQGAAYVDFTDVITEQHPGGVMSELMTIYSIVNTLILNIPQIDSVKILIGRQDAATLAGHIDLRFPFEANLLLIR